MKIELKEITVREVATGYVDHAEEGVYGYGGFLDIRPKYQREFIYDDKRRNAVIDTIKKEFPLNVMYWVKNEDGTFEVLDGQQRTISFCQYVNGDFSIDNRAFHNLTTVEQEQILDYKLMIYFCEGNDREKLDWFRVINIAGMKLTDQELRNAIYAGPWLSDAKLKFSKTGCAAYGLARKYLTGTPIRQDYLETAIKWRANLEIQEPKDKIEKYMSKHQHDPNANDLWLYFRGVIEWVKQTFPNYRSEMKGVNWGELYDDYGHEILDVNALEEHVVALMMDDDVTNLRGIYPYVLTGDVRYLNIRAFASSVKRYAYEKQKGVCAICDKHFDISEMEADHITPWSEGGKTENDNCQVLCRNCNRVKSNK